MMGTNRSLATAGLVIAGLAGHAAAQFKYTTEVPHPPMIVGQGAAQFFDRDLGKWWSCSVPESPSSRAHIQESSAWTIVQDGSLCFPGTTIIVPFRIVTEPWFELDEEGNALDPDYIPPEEDMDGNEEDVCLREVSTEILTEEMVVEDENFPIIFEAMSVIEDLCGVTFVQRDPNNLECFPVDDPMTPAVEPEQPWIRIQQSTDECAPFANPPLTGNNADAVGMPAEGVRRIIMEDWSVSVMVHELMHAIGFYHEMKRADRDMFVNVREEHIAPNGLAQFTISEDPMAMFGDYDFESIMHYGRFAFTFNGEPTIEVLPPFDTMGEEPGYAFTIGSFPRPSQGDREALQHLYGPSLLFPEDPCTAADMNGDLRVNVTDLLLFIAAWSSGDIAADSDENGIVNDADLLDYLVKFAEAAGCGPTPPRPVSPEQNTFNRPG